MKFSGFSELNTPHDLLLKAKRDLGKMKDDKSNVDFAYNFFVTIEHMPDWLEMKKEAKKAIKDSSPILRVCSHLASGAKHFIPFDNYKSVKSVQTESVYEDGVYEDDVIEKWLVINLDEYEIADFGQEKLDAIALGQSAVQYWEEYLDRNRQP